MAADEPAGYVSERERGVDIVALPSVIAVVWQAISGWGTVHDWAAVQPGARAFRGRGEAWAVDTPQGAWVVRHYRRGGALAGVLGDRYLRLGAPRPLRELRASTAARDRGVPTPEIVAAVTYASGAAYRADLVTRRIPASTDLAELVLGRARAPVEQRVEAWRAAGRLLRLTFEAGIEHRDLNLRNILIQCPSGEPLTAWLLDLDRAVVHVAGLSDVVRRRMLARLQRSRRKLELAFGTPALASELTAFEEGLRHG
jgi:3-deoxy-D-manno-octulosonic acid kinase